MIAKMLRNPRYAGMVSYAGKHRVEAATAGDGWSLVGLSARSRPERRGLLHHALGPQPASRRAHGPP
ncbi:hypothetical protein ACIRPT_26155 [Streptomyces sp. NPDC101227]|uniref:hypothetical protein n=1 Tax=Streptomyces sp. NPDC101227 TaxID=3366136 RepID=UPI003811CDD3